VRLFFTADTHFNDPRILRLDRRPYPDLATHDAALVASWNAAVGEDDEVFHLGDFARGDASLKASLLGRLAGRKHLISGNNDDEATLALSGWASVAPYREIEWEGRRVTLCHYALRTWRDMGRGAIDLHGHSHGRLKPMTRQFDVGVDAFPFRPVTLEEIVVSRRGKRAKV